MGAGRTEQLHRCRTGRKHRRYTKNLTARAQRRLGKKLLDDAPQKVRYRGWAD